ncbi:hypothetical protein [Aphanothece sacrum]|nr:hypothetical protein [Aphanothece sacrum]
MKLIVLQLLLVGGSEIEITWFTSNTNRLIGMKIHFLASHRTARPR